MRAFTAKGIRFACLITALLFCAALRPAEAQCKKTPATRVAQPGGKTRRNAKDGAEMVYIPAGEFIMGSTEEEINALLRSKEKYKVRREWFTGEAPQRKVTLPGYYIYKNLVTVAQYMKFCQATGHKKPYAPDFNPNWSKKDHPIVNVDWSDAQEYCKWAGVSLPTEQEWEKAARGTDGRKFPWGNNWDASKCANSVGQKLSGTVPVGRYTDSPYGLADMAGNVDQWCADDYDGTGKYYVLKGCYFTGNSERVFRCAVSLQ